MTSSSAMRHLFRRSILWLLPVVIVPIGALAVMQYRMMRSLEQKTASAQRNVMRSSLEEATFGLENRMRDEAKKALTISEAQLANVFTLGDHFRAHPVTAARTFFAIRFTPKMAEVGYFDATGKEKLPSEHEIEAVKMAAVSWHVANKMERVAQPQLLVDERDPENRIILRPVLDPSMHVVGVMGVVLDQAIAKRSFAAIGTAAMKRAGGNRTFMLRVGDRFPKMANGREYITQPLGFVFTDWRMGLRDTCTSPEELAAWNFRNNALWTGGALVVLLGAIFLAIHAVARQMRLSQMKSDFVSNVSHELRTPLSSIRVFGEYMRLGRVTRPEKIREYGEYIEAESRRLTQLINNILDFSRIESAEKKYRFVESDIVELTRQAVDSFAVPMREGTSRITFAAKTPCPPMLRVDPDAFGQVMVNLLDNALKYSKAGQVEVTVGTEDGEVRISVRDHGIGIPQSEQKRIFEKFYRCGNGLVHDIKGSGLGLSIVEHVVAAHGGRVEVSSAPGEGSTFSVVLPIGAAAGVQPESERPAAVSLPVTERT